MCPCLVLIKERSTDCGGVNYYSPPCSAYVKGRMAQLGNSLCLDGHHVNHCITSQTEEELLKKKREDGDASVALCYALSLCDFSQSRLLINYQILNVKVTATPFHSGADKPAPHQHSRQRQQVRLIRYPWPYSNPASPALRRLPRQFQARRKSNAL